MEKLGEFDPDTQSVEDWLEGFEARADCLNINQGERKVKWCKSVIGGVGRKILKNIAPGSTWDEAKKELRRFFLKEMKLLKLLEEEEEDRADVSRADVY